MLVKGFTPIIALLTEVNDDGCKAEIANIAYFRKIGIDLVNETEGGDGGVTFRGRFHSDITRKKMSESSRQAWAKRRGLS